MQGETMLFLLFFLMIYLTNHAYAESDLTLNEIPESYVNMSSGNSLWTSLLQNCKSPTLSCVQENFYLYLDDTLKNTGDMDIGGFLKLTKNENDVKDSVVDTRVNHTDPDHEEFVTRTGPMGEITAALHTSAIKFVMTHDVEMQLPETFFDGAVFKISPKSIEDTGAIVNLQLLPRELNNSNGEARIFLKKLKEFLGEKLLVALLAILLIIKLLSVKFLFFLPMVMGVAAAKKLILKIVLFIFPFLTHIFKLCPYVPHGTKYHHHQHHISHIHHVPHGHHHHHDSVEVIAPHSGGPPSLHHHHHADHDFSEPEPFYKPHEHTLDFYADGPSLTHDFITHRKDKPGERDNNIPPWRAGQGHGSPEKVRKPSSKRPLTPSEIETMVMKAEKEAMLKSRLQQEQIKVQAENLRLQEQIRKALKLQEKLKVQSLMIKSNLKSPELTVLHVPPPNAPMTYVQSPPVHQIPTVFQTKPTQQDLVPQESVQQLSIQTQNVKSVALPAHDPFYSPILEKIDKILVELGFMEEPCRERLICSMYKNPPKFSPHSNLISAELSRDSNELQKPTSTNLAVIRFYKYVQAARDGQEKRDCIRLYPSCIVNTEQ